MHRITTLFLALVLCTPAFAADKKKIVIISGKDSHGSKAHNWGDGSDLLAEALNKESGLPVNAEVHKLWPKDWSAFDDAATVVILCDGGGRHVVMKHLEKFDKIMKKGVGFVAVHYAVEVPKGQAGNLFLEWMGGYFETHWSVNPHWEAEFKLIPGHPVANGVKPFKLNDEWYYHMRFQPKGVTPILSAHPPEKTLKRGDGAHSNNPHVRKSVLERKEAQHVAWAYQRPNNKGRGFGITGAHYHKAWDNDSFRTTVLNAIAWTAGLEVPKSGVKSLPNPTERLAKSQGKKVSSTPTKSPKLAVVSNIKPAWASKTITSATPGHAVDINVNIKGAKELVLVANDGGNGYSCDWCDWAEPRLVDAKGNEKKLTDLKWTHAESGHGSVKIGANSGGKTMRINGESVAYGIGTHANSIIAYTLPKGHNYVSFKARGGLDNGGTDQGNCGKAASVQFEVYTQSNALALAKQKKDKYVKRTKAGGQDPEMSLEALDVHDGLQAQLFAHEPMISNPSNVDIDHRGRAWVCEIVNYRRHKNKRAEGDRIVILEDSNGDGVADKSTVFYQGRDIDSPHGICVLPTPSGKGTKAIVSTGANVYILTDVDGDDKADKKETFFTGISGTQHDHGIHAFVFGPDGKLYFNFGNNGRQIKDRNGKPIIDMAGNEVTANRKPYQQGMVFRCNLDGSEFETLGWNFRNNWMATVDSFGTIWQSDNDDDGNRGVRINYVMEFGNYGYRDEMNGRGWKEKRTGMNPNLPWKHWYQNDPGVVPNLLHTGAGSPTGIIVYEGELLPKVFHNQVIHTDAGPNVCRAYPRKDDGAGYSAEMLPILTGARDRWFRPSDVTVLPDGSLLVADWYDPGVGGHNAGDTEKGRLFRVTPKGHKGYKVPKVDVSTPEGAVEALKSPVYATRYMAWQALHKMGGKATGALTKIWNSSNQVYRARALWLLGKQKGKGSQYVDAAISDSNSDIRIVGLRLARQLKDVDTISVAAKLQQDKSPQVRREVAIAIRHSTNSRATAIWATLAAQNKGDDRWYTEAVGLAADKNEDRFFAAYLKKVGANGWNTAGGRQVVWRSRSKLALPLLAKILLDKKTPADTKDRFMRSFDFHPKSPEKDKALASLLGI